MSKRKTLSAIKMTLFLIINIVMISCGSGGPAEQSQATKADGTVIDLAKVSKKIKDAVDFAASVKEVETLVKSVDTLAGAIGKKIKSDGTFDAMAGKNGSLLAGAYNVALDINSKLTALEGKAGLSSVLKAKVTAAKTSGESFSNKLKTEHTDLGKEDASDDNAKAALLVTNATKNKGVTELEALNTAVDELVTVAKDALGAAIKELTEPVKAATAG
ncbi:Vsp/OspC family lipoprotein (plasmid) [Borrelia miyamotoi]|uniref:Vsp/OspC family lipoprotein n=2 Tax=Borrelia miyamotoi TaxID=47466 RepID=A0A5P8AV25_9SPIR|nr:Vsp/OspC family lipoprotein [Borrelia miyamotoi]WAZ72322.1 Vsp/OspC family lipoprotein [Borrelia miyamotoi]WVI05319.1 Vsp/OspC family lipoprotein [Borrelia miyamotoi]